MIRVFVVGALALASLPAQTTPARRSYIRAIGEGSVSVRPDVARITFSVVTQAVTANDAATRNADQSTAVSTRLRQLLGANAEVRTVNYSLNPNYTVTPSTITGYTATNAIEASVLDLSRIGQVIDAGIGAGANRIGGLQLSLRDEEPARAQALRQAGQRARARAEAIAAGLNVRLGNVASAEEGFAYRPVTLDGRATIAATTPIEPGNLEIRATLTLEIDLLP